ncbi:hypothetical protein ACTMU2_36360 [Cupriavidus basilensis]
MFATNHEDIGTLYLLFSFIMLLSGGVLAVADPPGAVRAGPAALPPRTVRLRSPPCTAW